ncbi:hypothetical protein KFE25_005478 [Diacronema lutheri]|uniref:Kynureninase n=1 Tax=Diacronema lutheri TaxID=2081491 RepID=A0A8J6CFQ9_DIALT|nr:hypothetical protein KFE25_005478 [Diacronema lutheri]
MASLLAAHAAIGAWLLVRRARGPCAAATTEAAASAPPPPSPPTSPPSVELAEALALDASDELATLRRHFEMPAGVNVYLCGHSLGLMPAPAAALVREELDLWLRLGERGHFTGPNWLSYHERVRAPLARLVGASSLEVVAMNSLTVNLHLLMASFYNPSNSRFKIVIEAGAFPSDRIAVRSHAALRGYDAASAIVELRPRDGRDTLETADVLAYIAERGHEVALFLLAGVQYYSGQLFEIGPITAAARAQGCAVGWDLAHAVGNVPLRLHEWGVDFAAWCSYKYLNAGPGAIGGAFVHSRHCAPDVASSARAPRRLAGWWGNDPAVRFQMRADAFVPQPGADGWQLSNPPILQLAALRGALAVFDEARIERLVAKAASLTTLALALLDRLAERLRATRAADAAWAARHGGDGARAEAADAAAERAPPPLQVLTPRDPTHRGAQLSVRFAPAGSPAAPLDRAEALQRVLAGAHGVEVDYRRPDVLRFGFVPLYTRHEDVVATVAALEAALGGVDEFLMRTLRESGLRVSEHSARIPHTEAPYEIH